jgi:hypothetical protein
LIFGAITSSGTSSSEIPEECDVNVFEVVKVFNVEERDEVEECDVNVFDSGIIIDIFHKFSLCTGSETV